jgi:hypothetical protein
LIGQIRERPFSSRIFGLPKTHLIEHTAPDNEDHLVFHVWALSFLTGTRLTTTEAGFVDATPLKPGVLVDFVLLGNALGTVVSLAELFWKTHRLQPARAKLFAAAVHALYLGQNPLLLQFERFLLFYTAFDACFALAQEIYPANSRVPHATRVSWMCQLFGMPTPNWADPSSPSGSTVASIRNETVHEALFMSEPLGFALHGVGTNQNITLEMKALICRLLVALLGLKSVSYLRSPVDTRQLIGLKLD